MMRRNLTVLDWRLLVDRKSSYIAKIRYPMTEYPGAIKQDRPMRVPFRLAAFLLGVLPVAPLSAKSEPSRATYRFKARVNASSGYPAPPVGTVVPIRVVVNPSFDPTSEQAHEAIYSGGPEDSSVSPILAMDANGDKGVGIYDEIDVLRNSNGIYAIKILTSSPTGGDDDVTLTFSTTVKSVVKNKRIPKSIMPSSFQTATFAVYGFHFNYSGTVTR